MDSNASKLGTHLIRTKCLLFEYKVPYKSDAVYKNHIFSQNFIFTKPSGVSVVQLLHFLYFHQGLLTSEVQTEGVHEHKAAERIREVALYACHATLRTQYYTFSGTKY